MIYIKHSCILPAVTDFIYNNKEHPMQFFGDAICYCEFNGQDLLYNTFVTIHRQVWKLKQPLLHWEQDNIAAILDTSISN